MNDPSPDVKKNNNPALRGPIILAARGSSDSASATSIAQLIAARTGRSLQVVSVVEPASFYGSPPELQASAAGLDVDARAAREADLTGPFSKLISAHHHSLGNLHDSTW